MGLATESAGVLGDDWPGRGWAWRQSQRESSVMTGRTWMGLAGARACEGGWLSGQLSLRTSAASKIACRRGESNTDDPRPDEYRAVQRKRVSPAVLPCSRSSPYR